MDRHGEEGGSSVREGRGRLRKPFTIEVTARSVRVTTYKPVPGAAYLQPDQSLTLPVSALASFAEARKGHITYSGWTPEQLQAQGLAEAG